MKNKLFTVLLSVAIALGIWVYVITVVSPNSEKIYNRIPVIIDDSVLHERGLTVTNKEGHTVSLKVTGNRIDLKKIGSDDFKVTVDLSRVYKADTHELPYEIEINDASQNKLDVTKITPGTISLNVEAYISKKIFVEPLYTGELDDFFEADKENISMDNKEIWITGPASSVENVEVAYVTLDLSGKKESITGKFPIVLYDGPHDKNGKPVNDPLIESKVVEVDVSLKILRSKEVRIEFKEIKDGGGATKNTCEIKIEPKSILISGSNAVVENFDDLYTIPETMDLSAISDGFTKTYPINLDAPGIINKSGITEITVTITFPTLDTVEMTISEISAVNTPEGIDVEVTNLPITVTLRGPKDIIKDLKPEDVILQIDCTNLKLGGTVTELMPQLVCEYPDVGVVGLKKVPITVFESRVAPENTADPGGSTNP